MDTQIHIGIAGWSYADWDGIVYTGSLSDKLAGAFETLTVIANNHYRGAELANALELKALVTGEKQLVPEGLLRSYPDLARIVGNLMVHFPNNQLRLSLCQLPAESQNHKLYCARQEFTIVFARQYPWHGLAIIVLSPCWHGGSEPFSYLLLALMR